MNKITLEQFIKTFNFGLYRSDIENEHNRYDTNIVRFYIDDNLYEWFELGLNDEDGMTWERACRVLNDKILQSRISTLAYDNGLNILKVFLDTNVKY